MKLLVLAGDGIGPEITAASVQVLETASNRFGLNLKFEHQAMGHAGIERVGASGRTGRAAQSRIMPASRLCAGL